MSCGHGLIAAPLSAGYYSETIDDVRARACTGCARNRGNLRIGEPHLAQDIQQGGGTLGAHLRQFLHPSWVEGQGVRGESAINDGLFLPCLRLQDMQACAGIGDIGGQGRRCGVGGNRDRFGEAARRHVIGPVRRRLRVDVGGGAVRERVADDGAALAAWEGQGHEAFPARQLGRSVGDDAGGGDEIRHISGADGCAGGPHGGGGTAAEVGGVGEKEGPAGGSAGDGGGAEECAAGKRHDCAC